LTDPFGMCELQRSFSSRDTLVVTPQVHQLPHVALAGEWTGSGESRARSLASAGEDDAGIREYRVGDDLRRVHWRSTARLDKVMVRREEQPWQARATVLLDSRSTAHGGEGPGSSFEWSVSAAASVGVHLVRSGYHVRLVTDTGANLEGTNLSVDGGSSDVEGALLDALAVIEMSAGESLRDAGTSLRRGGGEGLVIAVLGSLELEETRMLARLRHGSTAAVAILLDTNTWNIGPTARAGHRTDQEGATDLLRASGWRVLRAKAGDALPDLWVDAGRPGSASSRILSATARS
jgi:uncharacterized protein (DUF58 family)